MKVQETPVKVAIIAGQLGLGGAEQQLYYFLSGLDRARFRPTVINLGIRPGEYWERPISALNVPISHVSRSYGRPWRVLKIAAILRSAKVAIVHGWAFHTNPYSALAGRLAGVPVRLGSMRENYAGIPGSRFWRRMGLTGLDALITNSRTNVERSRELRAMNGDVRVVPNGINLPDASLIDRAALKAALGLSPADTVIGTISRIDENKNHSMLIRAFSRLTVKWPGLRLVIIGDGPLMSQLAAEASHLGISSKVRLTGAIPLAARYLPAFDVCCLTSHLEGVPNLLMEASAAGLPAVATDCGGSGEVIASDITGFLVPPDDDAEFAARVDMLLTQPEVAWRMGQAGRVKMGREFSIEAMVARMTDVYRDALTRGV